LTTNMVDFIYDIYEPTMGLFYLPYYPATILLFIYISYILVKKKAFSKWKVIVLSLFSFLPTLLMIIHAILELTFVPNGYQFGYVILYFGIGMVINLISSVLLVIYLFKRHAK
jgi:hypothetical protein